MSLRNFFRELKQAMASSKEILDTTRESKSEAEAGHKESIDLGKKLLIELRRQKVLQKPLYQEHLQCLRNPAASGSAQVNIGYSLERIARKLNPTLIEHDLSKPTLVMVCIGDEYAKTVELGTRTKQEYCKLHGYNLAILESVPYRYDRPPAWLKIPLLFRLMQTGHHRLFYLDADSLITNPKISLEPFFDRLEKMDRHMLIAEDVFNLNTGAFFLRKTWQALTLLDLIYETDADVDNSLWEQQALIELIEQNPVVRSLLHIEASSRQFNSMPFDERASGLPSDCSAYAWQPGDFLCHFAGTKDPQKLSSKMQRLHQTLASSNS